MDFVTKTLQNEAYAFFEITFKSIIVSICGPFDLLQNILTLHIWI